MGRLMGKSRNIERDRDDYLIAWSEMMIKIWMEQFDQLEVRDSGQLEQSLRYHLTRNAGGDIGKITFAMNWYGLMVDAGHGRGQENGNREAKKWFSSKYGRSKKKLIEAVTQISAEKTTFKFMEAWRD